MDSGSPAKSSAVNIQFIPLWPLCKILSAVCSTLLHIMGISRSLPILKLRRLRFLIALAVFEVAAVFFSDERSGTAAVATSACDNHRGRDASGLHHGGGLRRGEGAERGEAGCTADRVSGFCHLAQAYQALYGIDQFGGIVADAILEDEFHFLDLSDVGRWVALEDDKIRRFANR